MANPYVFIVGCPRSGTTLLRRIVDAHPQIGIMPESHWIPRFYERRKGLTLEGLVTPDLIPQLLNNRRFANLHVSGEKLLGLLATGRPVSYADFICRIFDLWGERREKFLVGDKTPSYVRQLNTLHTLWPRVRFVHLVRDGRDVFLSTVDWHKGQQKRPVIFATWKGDAASTGALWWELNVRLGRAVGNLLGPELYYEIRYESLVRNPVEACMALCAFLGLPYDEAMPRFHEGRTNTKPGLSAKKAWLPITPGLRDWRSQMPAQDAERFEAAAGELLDELGYPRAISSPRPETLEHTQKIRNLLVQDPSWNQLVPQAQAEKSKAVSTAA